MRTCKKSGSLTLSTLSPLRSVLNVGGWDALCGFRAATGNMAKRTTRNLELLPDVESGETYSRLAHTLAIRQLASVWSQTSSHAGLQEIHC